MISTIAIASMDALTRDPARLLGLVSTAFGLLFLFAFFLMVGRPWVRAITAGVPVSLGEIILMVLRRSRPGLIVAQVILARQNKVDLTCGQLESHFLAEGNVENVVTALVEARGAGIELSFDRAAAIDLAGRDLIEAVRASILPRTLSCPEGGGTVEAVSADGVRFDASARVTVRTSLERLVGGVNEAELARSIADALTQAIGGLNAEDLRAGPGELVRQLLGGDHDHDAALEILAIDPVVKGPGPDAEA